MKPALRRVTRVAVKSALALLLLVALLEVSLRVLRPVSAGVREWTAAPQDAFDYASARTTEELLALSVMGFRPFTDQGGFVTNSRGFRTPEYEREKAPGTWRVVALGDSFTFASGGVPWPQLWTTRLATRLAAATTQPVELVNLGVPAVGASFELRCWQLEGAALQPDLVLLGLFVGNDFNDERWHPEAGLFARYGRLSCAARLLRNFVRGREDMLLSPRPSGMPEAPPPAGARGGYAVEGYELRFAHRESYYPDSELARIEARNARPCDRHRRREFELLFGRVAAALRQLNAEVTASGARLGVVLMPARVQIDAESRAPALAWAGQPDSDFDWDAPQRELASFLQAEGIPFLDLLPGLRAAATGRQLYTSGDTHWTPDGNAVVAASVGRWILDQGWLPGATATR